MSAWVLSKTDAASEDAIRIEMCRVHEGFDVFLSTDASLGTVLFNKEIDFGSAYLILLKE